MEQYEAQWGVKQMEQYEAQWEVRQMEHYEAQWRKWLQKTTHQTSFNTVGGVLPYKSGTDPVFDTKLGPGSCDLRKCETRCERNIKV